MGTAVGRGFSSQTLKDIIEEKGKPLGLLQVGSEYMIISYRGENQEEREYYLSRKSWLLCTIKEATSVQAVIGKELPGQKFPSNVT